MIDAGTTITTDGCGSVGGTTTTMLNLSQPPCTICRKAIAPASPFYGYRTSHDKCVTCPKCKSTFVVWQGPNEGNNKGRARLRCQGCLHGWRGKKERVELSVQRPSVEGK